MYCFRPGPMFVSILIVLVVAVNGSSLESTRKLVDESGTGEVKCGSCETPVTPPPPPPVACPPPPPPPVVKPPPSPKKPPSTPYCPPPPSSYIYITGPPGDLYPADQTFSAAHRTAGLWALMGFAVLAHLWMEQFPEGPP